MSTSTLIGGNFLPLPPVVQHDLSWLKHHVLLLAAVVLLALGAIYGVESLITNHDSATAVKYETILKSVQDRAVTDQKAADAREQLSAQREQQYQQMVVTLTAQLSARQRQEQQVQKQAATLTAIEAAQHITIAEKGNATAQGDNVIMDLPTSQKVVADVETLPLVRKDLLDVQSLWKGAQGTIADLHQTVADKEKGIADQKEIVTAQAKTCEIEKKTIRDNARKSKTKIGAVMTVVGFVLRGLVHF